jgi:hypothetical protein
MEELGRKKTIVSALVLHYSSGFLRRPQKYGLTFLKVLTLLGIVKSNGKIEQKFMAFSEYMKFTPPHSKKYVSSMNMNASPQDQ